MLHTGVPIATTLLGGVATLPVDPQLEKNNFLLHAVYSLIREQLLVLFLLLLALYLMSIAFKRLGDSWILEKLQFVLDKYQGKAFVKKEKPDPKDYHRITLFQYKKNVVFPSHWSAAKTIWPFGGGKHPFMSNYLVPVLRSGRLSRKTNAIFHVSDNGEDSEGVAGRAWVTEEVASALGLPPIRLNSPKRDVQAYAESTGSDVAMIEAILAYKSTQRRQSVMPRAIVAIPVERFGKNWGVLVLDSRDPDGIAEDAVENFTITVALIGQLLERL